MPRPLLNILGSRTTKGFTAIAGLIFCVMSQCSAKTIYVSPSGDGTDGSSWAKAFNSISAAYTASATEDTIHAERGTYNEKILLDDHPITVIGGFGGNSDPENLVTRDPLVHRSILEATPRSNFFADCTVEGIDFTGGQFGGLEVRQCSATIKNCDVRSNDNSRNVALFIKDASVEVINCRVAENSGPSLPSGVMIAGSSVAMRSCIVERNTGLEAALLVSESNITLENCILRHNSMGGMVFSECDTTIRNCLSYDNNGGFLNGAFGNMFLMSSSTFINLQSISFGGVRYPPPTSTLIENCIFWGHDVIFETEVDVRYSCVQGGRTGVGNIEDNPGFRNLEHEDYRLAPFSPCIDSASTSGPLDDLMSNSRPIDIVGVGRDGAGAFDMGAYEFQLEDLGASSVEGWELYDGS